MQEFFFYLKCTGMQMKGAYIKKKKRIYMLKSRTVPFNLKAALSTNISVFKCNPLE